MTADDRLFAASAMRAERPARVRFIANGEVRLCLETAGSGPQTLLFVHGWISSRRMWYEVLSRLDPERFTAHLLDFRGCGESDRPAAGHDLEGYAGDVRAAIAAVGGSVTIVAHSMGAKIVQYVMLDALPSVERAILVAPGTARGTAPDVRHRALTTAAFGSRERITAFQQAAMARVPDHATMERITTDALLAQREAWFDWYDRGRTEDFIDRLGAIAVPTYVLAADRDPLAPPARVRREVVERIAGAVFIVLRGVGHNVPVEAPGEVAALIARVT